MYKAGRGGAGRRGALRCGRISWNLVVCAGLREFGNNKDDVACWAEPSRAEPRYLGGGEDRVSSFACQLAAYSLDNAADTGNTQIPRVLDPSAVAWPGAAWRGVAWRGVGPVTKDLDTWERNATRVISHTTP